MKTTLIAACFVTAGLLAPIASRAEEGGVSTARAEAYVKDSVITTKVKARLAAAKVKSLMKISVDTDRNGMVVLSGTTASVRGARKAEAIARATEGVTSVENDIKIQKDD